MSTVYTTELGRIEHTDCIDLLRRLEPESVNLIVTSPPFVLHRQKPYKNVQAAEYLDWFRPFGEAFRRVLAIDGSLVIDIGGAWVAGQPARSLFVYDLLLMLCRECDFHLAQECYWWNPARLPSPAEWVTIRRIRLKDAVDHVWWLSPTPWPKADNRKVLQEYSPAMRRRIATGQKPARRPSGHQIDAGFARDVGGSIPPNLLAAANTDSGGPYLRYCRKQGIKPHPARFPSALPEFFVRLLTDEGDLVLDPFAGSCTTGEVCERLGRRWICCDTDAGYLRGAVGRFGT